MITFEKNNTLSNENNDTESNTIQSMSISSVEKESEDRTTDNKFTGTDGAGVDTAYSVVAPMGDLKVTTQMNLIFAAGQGATYGHTEELNTGWGSL